MTLKRLLVLFPIAVILTLPVAYFLTDWKALYVAAYGYKNIYLDNIYEQTLDGDSHAMFLMAGNYENGWNGLEVNDKQASEWYRKASDKGHAGAKNNLSQMYRYGKGVKQDYKEAVSLLNKAIELGSLHAYSNLGTMYRNGEGVEQDHKKAFGLFKTCTEQSTVNVSCLGNLGWMYNNGLGTDQDYEKAFFSWLRAAKQGNAAAQFQVGYFYDTGKGHIEKDRLKAHEWYQKSANQNYAEAQRFLGYIYFDGIAGISQNFLEAGRYFALAAKNDNSNAKETIEYRIKKCIEQIEGNFIKYDMKSCEVAAYSGDEVAMNAVARFFLYGGGSKNRINLAKAFEWYRKSADSGSAAGQYNLGRLYYNGGGTKKDNVNAFVYLKLSLRKNQISEEHHHKAQEIINVISNSLSSEQLERAETLYQNAVKNMKLYSLRDTRMTITIPTNAKEKTNE